MRNRIGPSGNLHCVYYRIKSTRLADTDFISTKDLHKMENYSQRKIGLIKERIIICSFYCSRNGLIKGSVVSVFVFYLTFHVHVPLRVTAKKIAQIKRHIFLSKYGSKQKF